jgi:hypothetical protein
MRSLRRSRGIHSNPWTHFPRLITSVDFIKRDTPLRLFHEILPQQATYPRRFDILVLDEAHNVSPSGSGHYAIDSQRTQAIREIVPHSVGWQKHAQIYLATMASIPGGHRPHCHALAACIIY